MKAPFFLAPMAEISHRALRELIEDFGGCDCYFSEMISAAALLANGPFEKWYIDSAPKPEKHVFQLVGSNPEVISRAAAVLDRLDCAGIDINMGCSAPLIRKTGAGAAWMASIDNAGRLISQVRPQTKRRLSVKLRIGFNEDFDYLLRFCRCLEDAGVELITLHPRTVMEKFKRTARWEYVALLKNELKIPVAGNGDVASPEDLLRRAASPCDAVMVGRAAVKMPWIFAQAKNNEEFTPNIEETGLRFLELLALYQPPEFHISRARRFFGFFCDNLLWGNYLKNLLNREESLTGIKRVWQEFFAEGSS
ncbi:MAG: tRNA-dihydrouridine synthase family protein [Treponema sp.]|jgi:tRNA-dihydrouridine synthase|nr:tRNA-dihydrouridine synthase family protein [Treponema sp.]